MSPPSAVSAPRRSSASSAAQIYSLNKTAVNTHLYVTDGDGIVLFDSDGGRAEGLDYSWRRDVGFSLRGLYGARSTAGDPRDSLSSIMFVGAPIRHGSDIIGVVSVSKPQRSMFVFIDETKRWIRSLGLIAFGAMAVGAVLVTRVFSGPIRRLTQLRPRRRARASASHRRGSARRKSSRSDARSRKCAMRWKTGATSRATCNPSRTK